MSRYDHWMPLYVGDYLADTMRLSTLQHGAYLLLLMEYWKSGPLPDSDEELAAIVKLDRRSWDRIAPGVRRFFSVGPDGLLHQKRADLEREKTARKSEVRRDAALTRYRGGGGSSGNGPDAEATLTGSNRPANAAANAHESARLTRDPARPRAAHPKPYSEEASASPGAADATPGPAGARDVLWQQGIPILALLTGKSEPQCRKLLGKLLRDLEDDCPKLLLVLQRAQQTRPADPLAWLAAAVRPRDGPPINGHRRHAQNGAIDLLLEARERAAINGSLLTDTIPDD